MTETDLQFGGGYTYQWECALLLALNYFFEPVRYNPTLFDLVEDFLGQVAEIHLEGKESGVELEDIALVGGDRRILVQVKTKQAEGEPWTPSDTLLCKALYKFYASPFLDEQQRDDTRFVFLTNRPFNRALVRVNEAISEGTVEQCVEADKLYKSLDRYARKEKKEEESIAKDCFHEMLARTRLVEYLAVDEVKANVQAKLQAHGRSDWKQAHAVLFEDFVRRSTRKGGGTVTRASVVEVLGPSKVRDKDIRDKELAYLDGLLKRYEIWRDRYTPLAGSITKVRAAVKDGLQLDLMPFIPSEFEILREQHGFGAQREVRREPVGDIRDAIAQHKRIVLLGDPGSGKTTTLWRMAYDYAHAARADAQAPLPLLVPLGSYTDDGPFDVYLARHLGPLAPHLETYRASGRLILLLDGLNEMPQAGYAGRVDRIRDVLDRYPDNAVVVTCRALDYVVKLEKLQEVEVSPLDETRIRNFLHNYLGETAGERLFWAMAGDDEVRDLWGTWQRAGGTWAEFWTAKKMPVNWFLVTKRSQRLLWYRLRKEPPPLLALGRNPYLLLMIAQVYAGADGELPANRARLFAAFVDTLLGREKKQHPQEWIAVERQKDGLATLAYAMQDERGRGTTVEREWALDCLYATALDCDVERLLYLATSATLLDTGHTTVRFYHQLLQEYFTARHIVANVDKGTLPRLLAHCTDDRWREVILLTASLLDDADDFLNEFQRAVDQLIADDEGLLALIRWAADKAASVETRYKPAAVRSYYCYLALNFDLDYVFSNASHIDVSHHPDYDLTPPASISIALDISRKLELDIADELDVEFEEEWGVGPDIVQLVYFSFQVSLARDSDLHQPLTEPPNTWDYPPGALLDFATELNPEDSVYNWNFTEKQDKRLTDYFNANRLLVQCLDLAYVTDRTAIENRLFLPPT